MSSQIAERQRKVLIVDDNRIMRHLLKRIFEQSALYEILEASQSLDALPFLEHDTPDIVVLDVKMPGELDGYQLCELIKTQDTHHRIKVVLLTACGQPEDLEQGRLAGADLYLTKPFDPRILLESIEAMFTGMS